MSEDKLYQHSENKKPWQSKTLWANVILAVVSFFPGPAKDFVTPENLGTLFLIVNTILRFVTKSGVSLT